MLHDAGIGYFFYGFPWHRQRGTPAENTASTRLLLPLRRRRVRQRLGIGRRRFGAPPRAIRVIRSIVNIIKDIGHELEFDYIKTLHSSRGIRIDTGLKYWRVTGKTEQKGNRIGPVRRGKKAGPACRGFHVETSKAGAAIIRAHGQGPHYSWRRTMRSFLGIGGLRDRNGSISFEEDRPRPGHRRPLHPVAVPGSKTRSTSSAIASFVQAGAIGDTANTGSTGATTGSTAISIHAGERMMEVGSAFH